VVGYIVYHYYLRLDRKDIHVLQQQQHDPLLCQTLNSNGRQYNYQRHEPFLCQTLNSNGRQYNNNNMNHSEKRHSCFGCYIVYHYCFRFSREVVHVVVGYIFSHYWLKFDRGEVPVVFVILSTIAVQGLTAEWITTNDMNHSSVKP
jgi:hypothetical protein